MTPRPGDPQAQPDGDPWSTVPTSRPPGRGAPVPPGAGGPDVRGVGTVPPTPVRPGTVTGALVCWVLTAVATVVHLMIALDSSFWQHVLDRSIKDAAASGVSAVDAHDAVAFTRAAAIVVAAASVTLYLFFAVMMHGGRAWARVVLTVLAALTVLTWFTSGTVSTNVTIGSRTYHTGAASPWVTGVFAVLGLVLMYLPASNAYVAAARRSAAWKVCQGYAG